MANIVEFIINITAKGSGVVARNVGQLQNRLDAADASANRLATSVRGNLLTALQSLPGASSFMNPVVAMTAGIGVVAKLGMQAQTTATSFEVLLGSQKASADMLSQMNAYAMNTPYSRLGVQDATKTMLSFGVASGSVLKDLKRLGDVAGGDNMRLSQLALVFGQIASAGKLQGQDLLQLVNAGYNPLQDIAALTGRTMADVRDQMSKGNIGLDLVRAALIRATSAGGRYYQMMDKIAQTESGKFGALKDTLVSKLIELYEVIRPLLIPAFEALTALLEALTPVIKGLAASMLWLVNLFKEYYPWIMAVTAGLAGYLITVNIGAAALKVLWGVLILVQKAQWLWNIAMTANPIGLIVAAVFALITALVVCWNKFDKFRAVVKTTWDVIKGFATIIKDYVVGAITSMLASIGKVGEALAKLFKGDFSGAWSSAKSAGALFLNVDGRKNAVANARALVGGIGTQYNRRLQSERARKAEAGIANPSAAEGVADAQFLSSGGTAQTAKNIANSITTGGTRNTSITLNIGNLIGQSTINMKGNETSLDEFRSKVVDALNRALQISTSAVR